VRCFAEGLPGGVVRWGVIQQYCIRRDVGRDKAIQETSLITFDCSGRDENMDVTPMLIMIAMSNCLEDKPLIGETKFGVMEIMIYLEISRVAEDEGVSWAERDATPVKPTSER
jgi:hypothetical protein